MFIIELLHLSKVSAILRNSVALPTAIVKGLCIISKAFSQIMHSLAPQAINDAAEAAKPLTTAVQRSPNSCKAL